MDVTISEDTIFELAQYLAAKNTTMSNMNINYIVTTIISILARMLPQCLKIDVAICFIENEVENSDIYILNDGYTITNQLQMYKESVLRSRKQLIKDYIGKAIELSKENAGNILKLASANIKDLASDIHKQMMQQRHIKLQDMLEIIGECFEEVRYSGVINYNLNQRYNIAACINADSPASIGECVIEDCDNESTVIKYKCYHGLCIDHTDRNCCN
jgi:hypothetical protein